MSNAKTIQATVTIDDFGALIVYPKEEPGYVGPSKAFAVSRRYDMERTRENGTVIRMIHPHHGETVTVTVAANPLASICTPGNGAANFVELAATVTTPNA